MDLDLACVFLDRLGGCPPCCIYPVNIASTQIDIRNLAFSYPLAIFWISFLDKFSETSIRCKHLLRVKLVPVSSAYA